MAKGSVRKKGKKWYYRFYVEDESGNLVQKEYAGTESKSETEALLRKAMEDYEAKKFVAKSENVTVGDLLDMWIEEEVKPGNLSNGTVMAYQGAVGRIKQFPIGSRKLKTVTSEHLQVFFDLLSFGGTNADGTEVKPISKGYMRQFSAVMQGAVRFAVFPKRLLTFNPMQYIKIRQKQESYELFNEDSEDGLTVPTISFEQYKALTDYLKRKRIRRSCPFRSLTTRGFGSARYAPSPGRTLTSRNRPSRCGAVCATTGRGTRRRSAPPSGAKSAQWTSATRWRRFSRRQRPSSTKIVSSTASSTV